MAISENCVLAMSREDYEANKDWLMPISRMIGAFVTGENHDGDEVYAKKKETYETARDDYREYQMQKRYNNNHK